MFNVNAADKAIAAIKRLAAISLLVALFLPLSRCALETEDPQTKAVERTVSVTYAYTAYRAPIADALATYAAFLWPLLLATARLMWPVLNRKWSVEILEVVFCLGSAYELMRLTFFGEWLYGAYVAAVSIGVYLIGALVELAARAREKWLRRAAALARR